jgi:tryptophan synthase beta chain
LSAGTVGVLHGSRSYLLQDDEGQVLETHSISAGLDYPGVGPEHAFFKESGRAQYVHVTDAEALEAFHSFARDEGIIPALESAHAIAFASQLAEDRGRDDLILVNLSGRGDKDIAQIRRRDPALA